MLVPLNILGKKKFTGNEEYDGWHVAKDSTGDSFKIVQPEMAVQTQPGVTEFKGEKLKFITIL